MVETAVTVEYEEKVVVVASTPAHEQAEAYCDAP